MSPAHYSPEAVPLAIPLDSERFVIRGGLLGEYLIVPPTGLK